MNEDRDDDTQPRWLELVARVHAQPDPATLARVRARLASSGTAPAWLRWLARPAALAASAALLVVSAFTGNLLLADAQSSDEDDTSVLSDLLGDDGSYGLPVERSVGSSSATSQANDAAGADSQAVGR